MSKLTFALTLPIVVLLGWLALLQYRISTGTTIRIAVTGYDPLDIFSGHYINYTIKDSACTEEARSSPTSSFCICFNQEAGQSLYAPYWKGFCDARPTNCALYVKGSCRYSRFDSPINRYSIPEVYSRTLARTPENSSIDLVLYGDGNGLVKRMYVGEQTVEEYAMERQRSH
jgi:hypothetical protein